MSPSMYPEHRPQDEDEERLDLERTPNAPLSRRGWGKHLLLSASALAVLFVSSKTEEVQAAPVSDPWRLGGNTNVSTDGTNFLGTINSAPLIIKTTGVERMRILANGNIGIGNTNPTARLLVDVATGIAIYARHTSAQGAAAAVRGDTNATVANAIGVHGVVTPTAPASGSTGVRGENNATNGSGNGVHGSHASNGYGVYGTAGTGGFGVYGSAGYNGVYASGGSYGIIAYGNNPSSTGIYGSGVTTGVFGTASTYGVRGSGTTYGVHGSGTTGVHGTSSSGTGVFGTSSASNGVFGTTSNVDSAGVWGQGPKYGLFCKATATSGRNYGIYASTASSEGLAGYFLGNVEVSGTLSKGGGAFKIDHPLDPENKYLYHSFVESPDMKNIYDGVATLDAKGEAVVIMPTWFEALNQEFRYQLTAMGAAGPNLFIADEIKGNRFRIAGGKSGMKVSWQVTGTRHDAFANTHRIPVEEQKPSADRGRYLHPEAFGKSASLNVTTGREPQAAKDGTQLQRQPEPEQVKPITPGEMRH